MIEIILISILILGLGIAGIAIKILVKKKMEDSLEHAQAITLFK